LLINKKTFFALAYLGIESFGGLTQAQCGGDVVECKSIGFFFIVPMICRVGHKEHHPSYIQIQHVEDEGQSIPRRQVELLGMVKVFAVQSSWCHFMLVFLFFKEK
jgi:hypothetical protein